MSKVPLDPFSKVVDEQNRWDPEWYSWLTDMAASIPAPTDLTVMQAQITALQAVNATQTAAIAALQTTSPPGLVFLSSQAASNSATITFTGINSTYDAYQFYITRLKPSVDGVTLRMQMSVNGGSTWKTTSNSFTWVYSYVVGGAVAFGHNDTAEGSSGYFRLNGASTTSWNTNTEVTLYPSTTGINLNMASWRGLDWHPSLGVYQVIGSGVELSDSTTCNAVRFFFGSGNMVSGRITMYGLRKT